MQQKMASSTGAACEIEPLPPTALRQACQSSCQDCQASELQKSELPKSEPPKSELPKSEPPTSELLNDRPAQLPSLPTLSTRPHSQTSGS